MTFVMSDSLMVVILVKCYKDFMFSRGVAQLVPKVVAEK